MKLGDTLVPSLLVQDMAATLEFYAVLGFEITGRFPEAADFTWAEVSCGELRLQFFTEPPRHTPQQPVFSGTLYFFPDSVEALAAELRDKVDFAWGPEIMDYGCREFAVRDPNGYFLAFTEPADEDD